MLKPLTVISCALVFVIGCESNSRTAQGAATGAVTGAVAGLILGALSGRPERGLVAGATIGAVKGGVVGFEQEQEDKRTQQLATAINQSNNQGEQAATNPASQQAVEQMDRFIGQWSLNGWVVDEQGKKLKVTGELTGSSSVANTIQLSYPSIKVESYQEPLSGQSMMGYSTDQGYSVVTSFTGQEQMRTDGGRFDAGNRQFVFEDGEFRVLVTFESPDVMLWQTYQGKAGASEVELESYRMTKVYGQNPS
ncbi:glycine zipper family protein [Paraferrimonas sedimenticola]|nr:glycine zipper family protein [Paraferrimonas sedimenticola]